MQSDRRDQAAAAPAQPREDESGRARGDHGHHDACDHADDARAEQIGEADVATGQAERRGDVPHAEQDGTRGGDSTEAPRPVECTVQHPAEREFFGDHRLQRNDDHRGEQRPGHGGVVVVHEHRPGPGEQRSDADDRPDQGDGADGIPGAGTPMVATESQFRPAQTSRAH